MKNQFIVHWQYDYEGENNLVKVMAHDTYEGAVAFLEKSANAGTIKDSSEEGYPHSAGLRWVKPGFEGTVAPLLARL
jgi:hypothetical protein